MGNLQVALMDTNFQRNTQFLGITAQLTEQQQALNTVELSRNDTLTALSTAVANGTLNIDTYLVTNKALYDEITNGAQAITMRNRVEKEAIAIYAETTIVTKKQADAVVSLYSILSKNAKTEENRIKYAKLLSLAILDQTRLGKDNANQVEESGETTESVIDNVNEAYKTFYSDLANLRGTDKDKAFAAIQAQADAYIASGISLVDVAKWQSEMISAYSKQETDVIEEEYKNQVKAGQSKSNALISMFGSEKDKAFADFQEQADAYLAMGVIQ